MLGWSGIAKVIADLIHQMLLEVQDHWQMILQRERQNAKKNDQGSKPVNCSEWMFEIENRDDQRQEFAHCQHHGGGERVEAGSQNEDTRYTD